jgi:photosystem II stability/assembly factor-like uncharacterized protein/pimeloyl-ACP methyl ester carboxylesterase
MARITGLLIVLFLGFQSWAQLERKPRLGAQLETFSENGLKGAKVIRVAGGTAEKMRLQSGDLIETVNSVKVSSSDEFITQFKNLRTGDKIELSILRNGESLQLKGLVEGRPFETDDNAEVIYDQADFRGGQLRVIINKPLKSEKMPAMLFIPGYTCSSIDELPAYHPYKRIVDAYVDAGFVTLRIEKSGLGDSQNTPACESCDLKDEIENFEVGLKKLKSLPFVDTNKIILVGHSMGGIVAPALSAKHRVAGVIVYGTTAKSWFEYQLEMYRVQNALSGMNPIEVEQSVVEQYDLNYRFFVRKERLEDMAKDPVTDSILRTTWQYDGAGKIYSRNAEYWRQIQDYPHLENWKNTTAKVLVQFGESDFQAFSLADHQQIVNTVNHFHPGNATLQTFQQTDHYFAKSGTMQDAYNTFANGNYQQLFDAYNFEVGASAVKWSKLILGLEDQGKVLKTGWNKLNTDPYPGKQDDITFINEYVGWYVNGYGAIYRTSDGGITWEKQWEKQGSFFRCIAFLDSLRGFVGTVGTDYFPNVTDTIPLYGTIDGGKTWNPISYEGPYVKGLCAIDIVKEQFINHGKIDFRYHIYAVGRVGSPANLMVSHDDGRTWTSRPVKKGEMLFDIKMFNTQKGIACSASSADVSQSNALILMTKNGGKSWKKVYQSNRKFETTWKVSFVNERVGYATIQSYNPDPSVNQQRIAKTTDGGKTWVEINLVEDSKAREFGIGFIDEEHGFVGTMNSGFETTDGGKTWTPIDLGIACNKIRIYRDSKNRVYGYAIGKDVFRLVN